jgi:hypothetical protein
VPLLIVERDDPHLGASDERDGCQGTRHQPEATNLLSHDI